MKKRIPALALALAILMTALPVRALAYSDVSGHWAQGAIENSEKSGFMGGYGDGTFRPDQPVTGAELAGALNSLLGTKLQSSAPSLTRQDAVVMIAKAVNMAPADQAEVSFADAGSISAGALPYVNAMANGGYVRGSAGRFNPAAAMTRGEAATVLDNLTDGGRAVARANSGTYVGKADSETGVISYKGVLFATNERYQAPVVVENSSQVKLALAHGPASSGGDPDALNLAIYTNPKSTSANKSVFMWQYGSAQMGGSAGRTDWTRFVAENPDIIVVTSSHRGGFWGSIDLSSLKGYDADKYWGSNNLARLDLLACLKWINQNISAFGGNPRDVTIGGQSSGSNNVTCLLMMEEARPYFQKAIMESSFSIDISLQPLEDAQFVSKEFFKALGVTSVDELMAKTNEELNEAQKKVSSGSVSGSTAFASMECKMFSPVIDGQVIPENYYEGLLNGGLAGIKCVFGSNEGEYDQQYMKDGERLSEEDALTFTVEQNWGKLSSRGWNKDNAQSVIDQFYSHNVEYGRDNYTAAKDLKNDLYLRLGSLMYAEAASRYTDVYMYYNKFDTTPEDTALADGRRSAHGSEIEVLNHDWSGRFDGEGQLFQVKPGSQKTAELITSMWAAFVRTGDPNSQELKDTGVTWTKYDSTSHNTLVIDAKPQMVQGVRQKDVDLLMPLFREYPLLQNLKVSSPGVYSGYSKVEYDGYKRHSVYVPVSDGTRLAVDYCIPTKDGVEAGGKFPVVFTYTPYGRQRADNAASAEWFTKHGYIFAAADARGMGASFGTRDSANSPQEAQDGADVVAWIHAQSWCDGKIGTIGSSYVGQTQLAILSKTKLVDASVIGCTDYNKYDGWIRGGVPRAFGSQPDTMWGETEAEIAATIQKTVDSTPAVDADADKKLLAQAIADHVGNGLQIPMFQRLLWRDSYSEEVGGEYWNLVSASTNKQAINDSGSAIYLMGGLYDVFRRDTIVTYHNLTGPKKMTIGPWYHTKAKVDPNWEVEQLRWFDYWLKGIENGVMDEDPIYLKTANQSADNGYTWLKEWPMDQGGSTAMYLNRDGRLSQQKAAQNSFMDYDVVYGITTGVESASSADVDAKGLCFTTAPMDKDFRISGHAMAHINFEMLTDDKDIDFFVTVSDYDPATGEAFVFDDGHLRASLRQSSQPPYNYLGLPWFKAEQGDNQYLSQGQVYSLEFDLMPTSYIIPQGHCLRVTVSNSMDRFYYLGRGEFEADPKCETPDIRLYTGGANASYVEFPDMLAE